MTRQLIYASAMSLALVAESNAAPEANYDESKVPAYTLPDPLIGSNGRKITTPKDWKESRRPEILKLFATHVYGETPPYRGRLQLEVTSTASDALAGMATRKQIRVFPTGDRQGPSFDLLLYVPNRAPRPVAAFLGLNFAGNQAVHTDAGIALSTRWMRGGANTGVTDNRATDATRGKEAGRWAIEKILSRGYALATVYYGDLEPDHAEGWKDGIRAALSPAGASTQWAPDAWGAIGAWAWGLSRALDALEQQPEIDSRRVALIGHSRLGKTALWAGAQDERFAIVISNNSGEGGAALARRRFGETTAVINRSFPHWFCGRFKEYGDREDAIPVDQHMLIALVAPRPVYVASAEEDRWADPKGEFLAAKAASPVYELLGVPGIGVNDLPPVNQPVGRTVGYHIRTGAHDVTDYDWDRYLDFADRHFRKPAAAP